MFSLLKLNSLDSLGMLKFLRLPEWINTWLETSAACRVLTTQSSLIPAGTGSIALPIYDHDIPPELTEDSSSKSGFGRFLSAIKGDPTRGGYSRISTSEQSGRTLGSSPERDIIIDLDKEEASDDDHLMKEADELLNNK